MEIVAVSEEKKVVSKKIDKETWMKGLKIIEAEPANSIDIYALLTSAQKEKAWGGENPTEKQLKDWHFLSLMKELVDDNHSWLLARRGKHYFGCAHAVKRPGRWPGDPVSVWIDMVFVDEKRRKHGIGKKLVDAVVKWAENNNIKQIYFFSDDKLSSTWQNKRDAKQISNYMKVVL